MTRNSVNARLATTSPFLAFSLFQPIRGVRKATSKGMAIIRMGE